jgi:hypothetical protein
MADVSQNRGDRKFLLALLLGFAAIIFFLLLLGLGSWRLVEPYVHQTLHLHVQHQLSHELLPVGTVIYTEDPLQIAKLQHNSTYRSQREYSKTMAIQYPDAGFHYPAGFPEAWERVSSNPSFLAVQHGWTNSTFRSVEKPGLSYFGYSRTSAGGVEWIVRLEEVNASEAAQGRRKLYLTQAAYSAAEWKPGSLGTNVSFMGKVVMLDKSDIITLFAPQPDSVDVSRITIPYELNGNRGELSATVFDNGYLNYAVESGPAKVLDWRSP